MPKSNEYLTLKEVQEGLLPIEFRPTKRIDKIQKLYESTKGVIIFREAKIKDSNELQYGLKKETVLKYNVSYVCLTVGFNGVLFIPSELLINYFDDNDSPKFANGRSELKVHIIGNKFILKSRKTSGELDLTHYFIPNDNDDSFCDVIQESQIEDIWEEARAFIIEVDHILEKSQGGGEAINNLLVLCPNCHAKKTYGVIKINSDYSIIGENGEQKLLKQNKHLD